MSMAILPMSIIEKQILCRLPVKTLLRCKSVCKLWYSLIKNPNFINNHYHHQTNRNRNRSIFVQRFLSHLQQLPITPNPSSTLTSLPTTMVNDLEGGNLLFSYYYLGLPGQHILVRPVNGFLLMLLANNLADRCRMAMFNPATRQFRQLCDFEFNTLDRRPPEGYEIQHPYVVVSPYNSIQNHIFGYGISKYTNPPPHVYKVVWLNVRPEERDVTVAKVFTVGGDGDWRMINAALPSRFVTDYSQDPDKNISMNGKCYWLSNDFVEILVFDMEEEVFQEMNSPVPSVYHPSPGSYNSKFKDVVFSEMRCCGDEGNSLALFVFGSGFVDISVMDKQEEWHWIRSIVTCIDRPISDLSNPEVLSQFPVTDGSILLKAGRSSFALYNPKTSSCVQCREPSPTQVTYHAITVFNFKESLFSVDGGIQVSDCVLEDFSAF